MVSDPGEALGEVPEAKGRDREAYWRQLVVTLVLLALYWQGQSVGLPFLDRGAFLGFERRDLLSILALNLNPLITGFVLVELFSLVTRPGKRLRRGGLAGRATLNRAALVTSLISAALQAFGVALSLERMTPLYGEPAVSSPGWVFRTAVVVTLTAVTAALFAMGNFLSVRGIGNGFCLFLLTDLARSVYRAWKVRSIDPVPFRPLDLLASPLVLAALLLLAYILAVERRRPLALLPAFPQGIVPMVFALSLLGMSGVVQRFFTPSVLPFEPGPWLGIAALLVLIPLLSWAAFHLFSGPSRLKSELAEEPEELAGLALALRRRLPLSTATLALAAVGWAAWNAFGSPTSVRGIGLTAIAIAVAVGLDLRDQLRFTMRHGRAERLLELDNVHLAHRLAERLQSRGLDVHLQARRYRSLFFFFTPLVKIGLLVPQEQVEKAWQEIEEVPVEVV